MTKRPRVTVLGSLNMDISVTVPRLPGPGATVLGSAARFTPGGKGANQAVAAARLGAEVRMVGCVGDDDFGRRMLAALRDETVDVSTVRHVTGAPTGLAMIAVDEAGENLIIVAPGANHEAGPPEVAAATRQAEQAEQAGRAQQAGQAQQAGPPRDILVLSAEIPLPTIRAALAQPGECVLNLAPAPPEAQALVAAVGKFLDWLVVNESEAAAVLGHPVSGLEAASDAAAELIATGPRNAVVTAGAHGAALAGPDGTHVIEGFKVQAVDTVGAGDTFVGALATAIAAGVPGPQAIRAAAAAGAAAVTKPGAQTAMPRPADILAATGEAWPVG